jgi:hypothetical protein
MSDCPINAGHCHLFPRRATKVLKFPKGGDCSQFSPQLLAVHRSRRTGQPTDPCAFPSPRDGRLPLGLGRLPAGTARNRPHRRADQPHRLVGAMRARHSPALAEARQLSSASGGIRSMTERSISRPRASGVEELAKSSRVPIACRLAHALPGIYSLSRSGRTNGVPASASGHPSRRPTNLNRWLVGCFHRA